MCVNKNKILIKFSNVNLLNLLISKKILLIYTKFILFCNIIEFLRNIFIFCGNSQYFNLVFFLFLLRSILLFF